MSQVLLRRKSTECPCSHSAIQVSGWDGFQVPCTDPAGVGEVPRGVHHLVGPKAGRQAAHSGFHSAGCASLWLTPATQKACGTRRGSDEGGPSVGCCCAGMSDGHAHAGADPCDQLEACICHILRCVPTPASAHPEHARKTLRSLYMSIKPFQIKSSGPLHALRFEHVLS